MSDTNDMRRDFEAWFSDEGLHPLSVKRSGNSYGLVQAASAWVVWQAATKSATASERERCARACENRVIGDMSEYDDGARACAEYIRQGDHLMKRGSDGDGKPFMGNMQQVLQDYQSAADIEAREVDRLNAQVASLRKDALRAATVAFSLMVVYKPDELPPDAQELAKWLEINAIPFFPRDEDVWVDLLFIDVIRSAIRQGGDT